MRPMARDARTPKTTISLILGLFQLCAAGRRQRRFERFAPYPGSQNISVSRRRRWLVAGNTTVPTYDLPQSRGVAGLVCNREI